MGALRQRMDHDMVLRGLSVRTRESYQGAVAGLARYTGKRPDRLNDREVQAYLLYLITERKLAWSSCNVAISGLRFFYHTTLGRARTTFTLPHLLNPLVQRAPRVLYGLLFGAAAATLQTFGRDRRHLGGELGLTAVLHTWGQTLSQHVHLHCVVTGGALSVEGDRWISAQPGFLFPVKALSQVFRGKFLAGLADAVAQGRLPAKAVSPARRAQLRRRPWVVYAKPPFGGPAQVLAYLGRYTHRIAISNHRIVAVDDGLVRFRYRDYADGSKTKILQLATGEFLRRFCLHVLPKGFMRIRHFGLLANRSRGTKLTQARALLGAEPPPVAPAETSTAEAIEQLTGIDITHCPVCGTGRMHPTATWRAGEPMPRVVALLDSS